MSEVEGLLRQPQARVELSIAGHKASKALTWNHTAERFLQLLDEPARKQKELQAWQTSFDFSPLFVRQFDKGKGTTYSQALRLPSRTPESLEKGVIGELLRNHNTKGVQGLLTVIGKTEEEAKAILHDVSD